MIIDCHECEMYQSEHCKDCLVTALLGAPDEEVELAEEEQQAIANLQAAGVAPVLLFRRKAG